jgi:hypothetical protein
LALAALVLTTALLAALTGILRLLTGLMLSAALLLARLVMVTLVLLSALVWIISHYLVAFRKLPGRLPTIWQSTSSD